MVLVYTRMLYENAFHVFLIGRKNVARSILVAYENAANSKMVTMVGPTMHRFETSTTAIGFSGSARFHDSTS